VPSDPARHRPGSHRRRPRARRSGRRSGRADYAEGTALAEQENWKEAERGER